MDDLISRQDAIDALCNSFCGGHHDCEFYPECGNLEDIQAVPSAESEIIHCKNCKHRDSNDCPMHYEEWIEIDEGDGYFDTDTIIHDWTTDEGFCHCAELRGEEDE